MSFTYEVGAEVVFENEEKYREFLEAEKKRIDKALLNLKLADEVEVLLEQEIGLYVVVITREKSEDDRNGIKWYGGRIEKFDLPTRERDCAAHGWLPDDYDEFCDFMQKYPYDEAVDTSAFLLKVARLFI